MGHSYNNIAVRLCSTEAHPNSTTMTSQVEVVQKVQHQFNVLKPERENTCDHDWNTANPLVCLLEHSTLRGFLAFRIHNFLHDVSKCFPKLGKSELFICQYKPSWRATFLAVLIQRSRTRLTEFKTNIGIESTETARQTIPEFYRNPRRKMLSMGRLKDFVLFVGAPTMRMRSGA